MKYPVHQLKVLSANTAGRDFVIGDLHGCHGDLMRLMAEIGFDPSIDRLLSVGDLVDRGPASWDCLQLIDEPWFYPVWGNHESLMLNALTQGRDSEAFALWMLNGGDWALQRDLRALHRQITAAAATVPLALEVPCGDRRVGLIHADVPEHDWEHLRQPLSDKQKEAAIWSRSAVLYTRLKAKCPPVRHLDLAFMGHTPLPEVITFANRCYLDTGAGYRTGKLNVVEVGTELEKVTSG